MYQLEQDIIHELEFDAGSAMSRAIEKCAFSFVESIVNNTVNPRRRYDISASYDSAIGVAAKLNKYAVLCLLLDDKRFSVDGALVVAVEAGNHYCVMRILRDPRITIPDRETAKVLAIKKKYDEIMKLF